MHWLQMRVKYSEVIYIIYTHYNHLDWFGLMPLYPLLARSYDVCDARYELVIKSLKHWNLRKTSANQPDRGRQARRFEMI